MIVVLPSNFLTQQGLAGAQSAGKKDIRFFHAFFSFLFTFTREV
jgi:hypothetical protein